MTTKYRATFSDGKVIKRTSRDRMYTHAWRVRWTPFEGTQVYDVIGFAGSKQLADKALSTATPSQTKPTRGMWKNSWRGPSTIHFAEVVPVEVVS